MNEKSNILQDIDGAVPNPRMGITSQYNYLDVQDIDGASPKKLMGVFIRFINHLS